MEELDKIDWQLFRAEVTNTLNATQFELVCQLHSKYFKHRYYKPCSCNPKKIVYWIQQLNDLYDTNREDQ